MNKKKSSLTAGDLKEGDFFIPLNPKRLGLCDKVYQMVGEDEDSTLNIILVEDGDNWWIDDHQPVRPVSRERGKAFTLLKNVSYHYFIDVIGRGSAVVALAKDEDNWYYGVSYCSPEDQFVKIKGRGRALSRMLKVARWTNGGDSMIDYNGFIFSGSPVTQGMGRHEVSEHVVDNMARRPKWAKKALFHPRNKIKSLKTKPGSCCATGPKRCEEVELFKGGCAG